MREVTDEEFSRAWDQFERMTFSVMRQMRIPLHDEDAHQHARLALLKALRSYDCSRGTSLSTLYYLCLLNALTEHRYLREYGIRYPKHAYRLKERPKLPEVVSLNERYTLPHGEEVERMEAIPDPSNPYEEWIEQEDRRRFVKTILSHLSDEDRLVISRYYGLDGEGFTLQEIADMLGVTREAVRQRVHRIIGRLRVLLGVQLDGEAAKCRLRS